MKNAHDFQMSVGSSGHTIDRLPRGWVIIGAALAAWLAFAGLWMLVSRVFLMLLAYV